MAWEKLVPVGPKGEDGEQGLPGLDGQGSGTVNAVNNIGPDEAGNVTLVIPDPDLSKLATKVELQTMNELKVDKQQEVPMVATLNVGYIFNSNDNKLKFYKDSFGNVVLRGAIYKESSSSQIVAAVLPVGYRPKEHLNSTISGQSSTTQYYGNIRITSAGNIVPTLNVAGAAEIFIDVTFKT